MSNNVSSKIGGSSSNKPNANSIRLGKAGSVKTCPVSSSVTSPPGGVNSNAPLWKSTASCRLGLINALVASAPFWIR